MPPYIKDNLCVPVSDKDVLLAAVQHIQAMLPEGYQISVDFRRVDSEDNLDEYDQYHYEGENLPQVINGDLLEEQGNPDIDFELFTALADLAEIEEALPLLRGLEQSGQENFLIEMPELEQEEGSVEESDNAKDCPFVK